MIKILFICHGIICRNLWIYLADINEQAQSRLQLIIKQMQEAESVSEKLSRNVPAIT